MVNRGDFERQRDFCAKESHKCTIERLEWISEMHGLENLLKLFHCHGLQNGEEVPHKLNHFQCKSAEVCGGGFCWNSRSRVLSRPHCPLLSYFLGLLCPNYNL